MYVYFILDPDKGFVQRIRPTENREMLMRSMMAFQWKEDEQAYLVLKNRITGQTGYFADEDMLELYDNRLRMNAFIEDKERWLIKQGT